MQQSSCEYPRNMSKVSTAEQSLILERLHKRGKEKCGMLVLFRARSNSSRGELCSVVAQFNRGLEMTCLVG